MTFNYDRSYPHYITFTILSLDLSQSFEPRNHPNDDIQVRFCDDVLTIHQRKHKRMSEEASQAENSSATTETHQISQANAASSSSNESQRSSLVHVQYAEKIVNQAIASRDFPRSSKDSNQEEDDMNDFKPPKPFGVKRWRIFNSPNKMIKKFSNNFFHFDVLRNGEKIGELTFLFKVLSY
jgi:hypothetical protein